jgi:hypothetical protein
VGRTRLIWFVVAAGLVGACAGQVPGVSSVPVETALEQATAARHVALGEALRAGLPGSGTFGPGQVAVPVLVSPDVRRVWVPTHENAEGELIAGHWAFLRVRDSRWFLEAPPARDASPAGLPPERPEPRGVPASGRRPASGVPWVEVPSASQGDGPRSHAPGAMGGPPIGATPARPAPTAPGR